MSNITINYSKILEVLGSLNIENHITGKVGRPKKMSDIEVISLSLTAEYMSIDSENSLFERIDKKSIPNLLERSQVNKRRKALFGLNGIVRQKLAACFLEFEDCYIIDSMPLEICKFARHLRIKICKEEFGTSPAKGYCASQGSWYYGYKLHGVCPLSGVLHSLDITKANVHDSIC